jgi:hypothetical protein
MAVNDVKPPTGSIQLNPAPETATPAVSTTAPVTSPAPLDTRADGSTPRAPDAETPRVAAGIDAPASPPSAWQRAMADLLKHDNRSARAAIEAWPVTPENKALALEFSSRVHTALVG